MTNDVRQTVAAVIDVWNGASPDLLAPLLAPTYRGHMLAMPGGDRDSAGYADAIRRFRAANPGVAFRIIDQLAAEGRCVSRLEAQRPGSDAESSSISHGINISQFDDRGRLLEEWAIWSPWLDARRDQ